jgi:outer membrane protein
MKMLKLITVLGGLLISQSLLAAEPAKIGVIQMQKILEKAPQVQEINNKMSKKFEPKQKAINELQKKFAEQQAEYQRDVAVMSDADKQKAEKKLKESAMKLQQEMQAVQKEVNQARDKEMQALKMLVEKQLDKIMKKQDIDIILLRDAVFYIPKNNKTTVDVTDQVLQGMQ